MTANAFADDVKNCMDAGMNAHVSKPIEIDDLFSTISAYLG
jgi:CheY-like chemotaxis protein